jgi:hypothetical protein
MTRGEGYQYWFPVRDLFVSNYVRTIDGMKCDGTVEASQHLAKLLGLEYPEAAYWEEIILTDRLRDTLQLLAGPNGHTLIKVLEARLEDV